MTESVITFPLPGSRKTLFCGIEQDAILKTFPFYAEQPVIIHRGHFNLLVC